MNMQTGWRKYLESKKVVKVVKKDIDLERTPEYTIKSKEER